MSATMAALRKAQSPQSSPVRVQQQQASQLHALKQQYQGRLDQQQQQLEAVSAQLQQVRQLEQMWGVALSLPKGLTLMGMLLCTSASWQVGTKVLFLLKVLQ